MQRISCYEVWVLICLLLFLPTGCSRGPLIPVSNSTALSFNDDLDRKGLVQAIERSLAYLHTRPADKTVSIANQEIPVSRLTASLTFFQQLLKGNPSSQELQQQIHLNFDIFQAAGTSGFNPGRDMLVTGYFQPLFEGNLTMEAPYLYPLYSIPPDLVVKTAANSGKKQIGRFDNGQFRSYWSREEIDSQSKAAGNELVWLKSPIDVFFLQIQGSGHIRLPDGAVKAIQYASNNGHPYRSIGKFMVQTGRMKLENASMQTIRAYLIANPQELDEILFTNPSYIFFNWTDTHGAIGNLNQELTPGRSIAADQQCFPAGGLGFLKTRQPVVQSGKITGWKPVNRFVLVQDTGSAIRGAGRVDLFWGAGDDAGQAAGMMKENGALFFLLLTGKVHEQQHPLPN